MQCGFTTMKKIFLIGFMTSGKSTVGKELAAELNYAFYDLDQVIEQQTATTIARLFDQGEEFFREKERCALRNVVEKTAEKSVIAVGGGTPCHKDNMRLMLQNGIVIFLDVTEEMLAERLNNKEASRPMLQHHDWHQLLQQRLPFYQTAHHTIANNGTSQDAVAQILEIIKQTDI